jgi:hypothetical protein
MSLPHALLRGSIGFGIVSVGAFSIWALSSEKWLPFRSEGGMYLACTWVFLLLSVLILHPLVQGERRMARFAKIFIPAFIAYAALWCVGWFTFGMGKGEWLGSLTGSAAFAGVVMLMLRRQGVWWLATAVLFLTHSAGYFLGGELYYPSARTMMFKLLWGLVYGLGFGAGIGFTFWAAQRTKI